MMKFNRVSVELDRRKILEEISFTLKPHKITVLLGRNGCGKTTLLSCITGATKYTGEILLDDRNLALIPERERARRVALLPQVLPQVPLTVRELVSMGRNLYLNLGRHLTEADREQIQCALQRTDMEQLENRLVNRLSGGERHKAYLAMALAQNTGIIVLDEPTTYLDMAAEAELEKLLVQLKTHGKKTILMVMHDLTKAVELADQILILNGGGIVFDGACETCLEQKMIEKVFHVRRGSCCREGREGVIFYR